MSVAHAHRRGGFAVRAALVAAFILAFFVGVVPALRIETNLLALLPHAEHSQLESAAIERFVANTSRGLVFLVGADTREDARVAAGAFEDVLVESGAFESVRFRLDAALLDAARASSGRRFGLLSARHRELLESGHADQLARDAERALYSPLGAARALGFTEDPLGLTTDFLLSTANRAGSARIEGDFLGVEDDGRTYALITAVVDGDPFALTTQERVTPALERATEAARATGPHTSVAVSGILPHAAAATERARQEISLFGSMGLAGIVLLVIATFRSVRPLVLTVLTLGLAVMAGVTACQLVFGNVHVLTLTFGTSLLGVAVDYSIHYFATRLRGRGPGGDLAPEAAVRHLAPTLVTVCATTMLGYLALLVAPIAGLRQIALFSVVGLATACACVLGLYAGLDGRSPRGTVPAWIERVDGASRRPWMTARTAIVLGVLAALTGAAGVVRLHPVDDIRALQRSPQVLLDQEHQVRSRLGTDIDSRFILVTAQSPEALLLREEALVTSLAPLIEDGTLGGTLATSASLPSLQRQRENRALLARHVYGADGVLPRLMTRLGFDGAAIEARRAEFDESGDAALTPAEWLASPMSEPLRFLWLGEIGTDEHASVILLDGLEAPARLRGLVEGQPGLRYVDRVAEVSGVLGHYREVATALLGLVALVITGFLALRHGLRPAFALAFPAIGASWLTLGVLGYTGEGLTLFHVLSLLLVIGTGVDYAVFLRADRSSASLLAVGICTLTTLLSFGLLGFSSVPFVHAIGLTVSLGIGFAFALSFLTRPRDA